MTPQKCSNRDLNPNRDLDLPITAERSTKYQLFYILM